MKFGDLIGKSLVFFLMRQPLVDLTDCKDLVSLQALIFLFFTPTAPGLPRWSPIQVLTRPDPA